MNVFLAPPIPKLGTYKNLSEDFPKYSYLATLTEEDCQKLDLQIDTLRELSEQREKAALPINSIARLGTGAALTNTVTPEYLATYSEDGKPDIYGDVRRQSFEMQSKLRYWVDTDDRGCYLVVLESGAL